MSLLGGKKTRNYGSSITSNNAICVDHEVKDGDSFQSLAIKYNVSIEDILHYNRMYPTDNIFMKKTLKIPMSTQSPSHAPTMKSKQQMTEDEVFEHAMDDDSAQKKPTHNTAMDFLKDFDSKFESTKSKVHSAISVTETETQQMKSSTSSGKLRDDKHQKEKKDLLEDDFFQL
eukprot:m.31899 g.31899  ORF g.31899 m.31899 type:complete len:173 (+) comp9740_c0_seq2:363-881(+)